MASLEQYLAMDFMGHSLFIQGNTGILGLGEGDFELLACRSFLGIAGTWYSL
jgi:hypothetical protein